MTSEILSRPSTEATIMPAAGITGLPHLLRNMEPELHPGSYVFCTVPTDGELHRAIPRDEVLMDFKESEGTTIIISLGNAKKHVAAGRQLAWHYEAAWSGFQLVLTSTFFLRSSKCKPTSFSSSRILDCSVQDHAEGAF